MDAKKNGFVTKNKDYGGKATIIQVGLCAIANSALLPSGMTLGFTAVALPHMLQPNDVLFIDSNQASWIASVAAIVTPIGCLVSGPIIDRFGRRSGLLILNVPSLVGWILMAVNPNLTQIYLGRVLTGFALGMSSIPATVFITEGATPYLRGLLATGTSIAISMGVAIVYFMGLFLQEKWQLLAGLCGIFPVISFILIWWIMPESPSWLLSKGKYEKACESLMIFRGASSISEVQEEVDSMTEKQKNNRSESTTLWSSIKALARPESYKPLLLMNFFFFFQQLTGIFVVIFYAVDVIKEAGVKTDPYLIAVLIGLTRLIFTILAGWMSNKFGRRPCAILSGVGMTVSLSALATFLYLNDPPEYDHTFEHPLNETGIIDDNLTGIRNITDIEADYSTTNAASIIPVLSLFIYILTSTIGFLTLPWTMIGEIYPSKVRGVAGGLTTCITYIVSAITLKVYPSMLEALNKHGVFYFYAAMALLGTVFVIIFLPETQGKSLAEIEQYFSGRRKTVQQEEEVLHKPQKINIISSKA